uniref:Variant surface glycoprotein 310 n=1 Tax=Trypanosoma brucei TaxID=5691 RepID=M4TCY9_9TRYP|nr:variant surface glycoprotein 310 [Trypanosoma brucei]
MFSTPNTAPCSLQASRNNTRRNTRQKMTLSCLLLAALAIMLPLSAEKAAAAAGDSLKAAAWQPVCQLAEALNKVPSNSKLRLRALITTTQGQRLAAAKLGVYALLAEEAQESKAAVVLAAWYSRLADLNDNLLKTTLVDTTIDAVASSIYVKGRADEALNILAQAKTTSNGCLLTDDSGTLAAHGPAKIGETPCSRKLEPPVLDTYENLDEVMDANGWKSSHATTAKADLAGSGGDKTCKLLTVDGAGFGAAKLDADLELGGGLWVVNKDDKQIKTVEIKKGSSTATKTGNMYQHAWHKLQALDSAEQETKPNATEGAEATSELQAAITNTLHNGQEGAAGQPETAVLAVFPKPTGTSINNLLHRANEAQLPEKIAGVNAKTKLRSIVDTHKFQQIEGALILQLKNENTKLKTSKSDEQKDDESTKNQIYCNSIAEVEKCNADPKCSYETKTDGTKKCKFNSTKAKEKGIPVTQTQTGGTTGDGVKCSDHKDQSTCEKANEGKTTKVCGWRSGKDNEDEKDKVKCRDSSFLLSKQFTLSVVSAAFVALLF